MINAANNHSNAAGASITGSPGNWVDPLYDAAGNMTTLPTPTSVNQSYATLKYDAWNRMVGLNDPLAYSFEYDGLNRLIVRGLHYSATTYHNYYNEDWQVIVEATDNGALTPTAMYAYHPHYVDAIVNRMRSSDSHVYLADANYNVTALLEPDSTVIERYAYTPYGEVTVLDANFAVDSDGLSDVDNAILYTGRWRDPETGLQLNRERFYHAPLGRWVSRDPIGYLAGQLTYTNTFMVGRQFRLIHAGFSGQNWAKL